MCLPFATPNQFRRTVFTKEHAAVGNEVGGNAQRTETRIAQELPIDFDRTMKCAWLSSFQGDLTFRQVGPGAYCILGLEDQTGQSVRVFPFDAGLVILWLDAQ